MKMARFAVTAALAFALAGAPGAAWAEQGAYTLSYAGGAATLESDDLLGHVGTMWPGESYGGLLVISNGSESPAEAALYMVGVEQGAANRDEATELMERCRLTVSCGGSAVYDGPLSGSAMEGPVRLGPIEPGGTTELSYEIALPADLGNEFALAVNETAWGIEVTELPEEGGNAGSRRPLAQTGDGAPVGLVAGAVAAAALAAGAARRGARR